MFSVSEKQLQYLEYVNRENEIRHHRFDEEMKQYIHLQQGNPVAVAESKEMFSSALTGHLSNSPLQNIKYLFIASITLASRYAIQGNLPEEEAYNASDLYIQQLDACLTIQEVKKLHTDMISFFTQKMANLPKKEIYSKPIILSMDYIYYHLHEKILLSLVAEAVNLNSNYLATLFKKECGFTIGEYIEKKKIEAATNMLDFSDYSYSQIANILAFSSQSHFTRSFKKNTGYTPKQYRNLYSQR